jgi:predicted RNA-binding Zn ribbon-like protein
MPPDTIAFSLCAGHPALDLVNTLDNRFRPDGPTELLGDYPALLRFSQESGLLSAAQARTLARKAGRKEAERALAAARELREAAAAALYARVAGGPLPASELRTLEAHFRTAHERQELVWPPAASKLEWRWPAAALGEAELPVWALSLQVAALLTSEAMRQLRCCQSDACRWLFVDTSKNHTRRWCDMKVCGNRMKARRFQARRQV